MNLIGAKNLPVQFMKDLNLSFEKLAIDESKDSDEKIKDFFTGSVTQHIYYTKSNSHYINQ